MQQRKRADADRLLVRYDAARRTVTVSFQGEVCALPGTFPSYDEAMIAGYSYARARGWQGA